MFNEDINFAKEKWNNEWSKDSELSLNDYLTYYKFNKFIKPWFYSLPKQSSVCEIGCGNGQWLKLLRSLRNDLIYHGIDTSTVALEKIKMQNFVAHDFDISILHNDYPKFDVVFSWGVIEHLHIPEVAIFNHLIISKKYVIIDVPNFYSPATLYLKLLNLFRNVPKKNDWIINGMRFKPNDFLKIINRLIIWDPSWKIVYFGANYTVFPCINKIISKLDSLMPNLIRKNFGHNFGVILKKI
mgnify:CR=1 FL=1|tara:strand:- start:378 stop:1100 length:723 start_codon:yes stop_codon:yes gene_type:complete